MVIPVVKAAFVLRLAIGGNPANAGVTRLCGVSQCPVPDTATALPKQARYQLRYTRLFSLFIRLVVFSQMWRPTNWATPGYSISAIIPRRGRKSKGFRRRGCLAPEQIYRAGFELLAVAFSFSLGHLGASFSHAFIIPYRVYYAAFNAAFTTPKRHERGSLDTPGRQAAGAFAIFRRTAQARRAAEAGRSTRNAFSRDKAVNIIIQPRHKCKKILYRRTKFCYNLF